MKFTPAYKVKNINIQPDDPENPVDPENPNPEIPDPDFPDPDPGPEIDPTVYEQLKNSGGLIITCNNQSATDQFIQISGFSGDPVDYSIATGTLNDILTKVSSQEFDINIRDSDTEKINTNNLYFQFNPGTILTTLRFF